MIKTRIKIICVLIACITGLLATEVSSISVHSHSLSDEERDAFLQRVRWETIDTERRNTPICCFDVASDGTIALATSEGVIYVYDKQGSFLFGCSFYPDGVFGIEFDEDELVLHFLRGNTTLLIDDSGDCIDIQKADDPIQHTLHIKEIHSQTFLEIGNTKYFLEREIDIGDSYSRFVITENGKRMVHYDVTSNHIAKQVMLVATPICFFAFVIYGLAKKQNKKA